MATLPNVTRKSVTDVHTQSIGLLLDCKRTIAATPVFPFVPLPEQGLVPSLYTLSINHGFGTQHNAADLLMPSCKHLWLCSSYLLHNIASTYLPHKMNSGIWHPEKQLFATVRRSER
jgi:hypothetical protein